MTADSNQLDRHFGLTTAVAAIVSQVIGVGIFLTPAGMAKAVASPFWLVVVWLVMGAMTLSGALCYSELASRFPASGGTYVYLREAYGDMLAFLYGWTVLLVLDPGLTAIFGVGIAEYTGYLIPISAFEKQAIAVGVIAIAGTINILGARLGSAFIKVLTALKLGALMVVIVYGLGAQRGSVQNLTPFVSTPPDVFGALAGGLVGAFFAFAGWWEVTRIAGEIAEPKHNVPRALVLGVLTLTVVYTLTSLSFMYLVPVAEISNDQAFAALAGEKLFGPAGGNIFSIVVIVSLLGTLFAYMMVSPRLYFAMASDGLFFKPFGKLHPKLGTPYLATIVQILIAILLVFTGSFDQIVSYFFFVVVVFITLSVAGLFWIHNREFDGYKVPLFPLLPIFFLIITAIVLFFIAMQRPLNALIGMIVVLLGVPVYYLLFRRVRKA